MEKLGIPVRLTSSARAFVGPAPTLERYELPKDTKGLLTYQVVRLMDSAGKDRLYFVFLALSVSGRVFEVFVRVEKIEELDFAFLHDKEAREVIASATNFLHQLDASDFN